MIISLLDNDLYKFTMQNAVIKRFPRAKVRYEFINRGETVFPDGFAERLREIIYEMNNLQLQNAEKDYLASELHYLDPTYLDFLNGYRYNPSEVGVVQKGGELFVTVEGYWYRTILWEVPLMSIISELYFKMMGFEIDSEQEILNTVNKKATHYKMLGAKVADFGSRRRYSFNNHDKIVSALKSNGGKSFTGTSNVYFAYKYKLTAIGTHAHEWFMFHAAKYGYKIANKMALENWVSIYRGDLGIALSDTFTTDVFYQAFDTKFAKLFDGVRQDSGDPLEFADKTIAHYKKLRIDPLSKTIVFSDGLNPDKVDEIEKYCRGRIGTSYGIGTNFTNDVGVKALNMVIKIVEVKPEGHIWEHAVKLSDSRGKYTGDKTAVSLCKEVLHIK